MRMNMTDGTEHIAQEGVSVSSLDRVDLSHLYSSATVAIPSRNRLLSH
jgi:hypothetical protein